MGSIFIMGLRELGTHGVLPEEQSRPQPFEVDIELQVDLSTAGQSDDIAVRRGPAFCGTFFSAMFP